MKNILLTFILFGALSFTEFTAQPSQQPSKPITKPINKPSYDRLNRDDYVYDPYYYNDEEIAEGKALKEKKDELKAKEQERERELNATRKAEQKILKKKNKAAYDKAMKKFDNKKSTIPSKNSIIVSDEPIQ